MYYPPPNLKKSHSPKAIDDKYKIIIFIANVFCYITFVKHIFNLANNADILLYHKTHLSIKITFTSLSNPLSKMFA